ncbi:MULTISPECIES: IS5 family transposase [Streptomyces]|uniref:IS5 family transposase n=1 Tax=Streptomyces TaxID=1883 RepID=UPI00237DCF27|nr:IS5 family transposase [Streptomyces sp. G7(2002)]WDT52635.1 IS5 family transposase [Streptomyces sp. G7(2002)]
MVSLADAQWARIEPLLPDRGPEAGWQVAGHRQAIDAIAWKYRTGSPWMDLPAEFGSWKAAHNSLRKWAADGTWQRMFTALLPQAEAEGDLGWVVAVDSTIVRAHQHAAGPSKGTPAGEPADHALGVSGHMARSSHSPTASTCARRPACVRNSFSGSKTST